MECPICLEDFDDADHIPASLPCGHSFCLHHGSKIRNCPNCRAKFDSSLLKKNLSLIEAIKTIRTASPTKTLEEWNAEEIRGIFRSTGMFDESEEFLFNFIGNGPCFSVFPKSHTVYIHLKHSVLGKISSLFVLSDIQSLHQLVNSFTWDQLGFLVSN